MEDQKTFTDILEQEKLRASHNEDLWGGEFGDQYHDRNRQVCRHKLWAQVLRAMHRNKHGYGANKDLFSVDMPLIMELGAGQGDNLVALRNLLGRGRYVGVDVNHKAVLRMEERGLGAVHAPITEVISKHSQDGFADMIITRGFLIHVPPTLLQSVYAWMAKASGKYICMAEYYSPDRREVPDYHGHDGVLWADDFAGAFLDYHPEWELVKCGFMYNREGGDDETWFLLEKVE